METGDAAAPRSVPHTPPDAPIAALRLRAVAPVAARHARLVSDARTAYLLRRLPGLDEWDARVRDGRAEPGHAFARPGVIELAHTAGAVHVRIDLAAYPALAIVASAERGTAPAPPPALTDAARALRSAVAGVLLEPLLRILDALGLGGLHVTRVVRDADVATAASHAGAVPLSLTFTYEGRRHQAEVTLAPALLSVIENWQASAALDFIHTALVENDTGDTTDSMLAALARLELPGRLVLGARRLPVATLHALAPGDVLLRSLPASLAPLVDGTGVQRAAVAATAAWGTPGLVRAQMPVTLDGLKLLIMKEATMTDELNPVRLDDTLVADQQENPIEIGELDLPVQFEVDTVSLPLSQLYALRPGYVLELPTPVIDAQLKLVTHGQTIGYGELVTVGEHLGIRILRMAHGDGPVQ
ncbi:type III secretion system cytoplasmic ring protein SctQ [Paraburkholderia sediminicola]|uniref:type III secretion system cytoplasmic ring protein SctQ n=1 Tax=Paraburkholderia sediminicola TaxID=458836 RepID=UPI0038B7AE18